MAVDPVPIPPQQSPAWDRVKALFFEAIEVAEEDRAAWLTGKCGGDPALRREVESLLASDRDAGSLFETPAAGLPGAGSYGGNARRLAPGRRLGHYEILAFIGAGGMGEVYRARDARDGREVAIKTVSGALAHPQGEARLLREARHASTLKHPNICAIHEVGEADGIPFIAMELVDGRALSAVHGDIPLPIDRVLRYGIDVADALDHAHAHGLVHRDLKRANVVISSDDRAIVLDFGLAKHLPEQDVSSSVESLTSLGHGPVGTLSHMAPEVLLGRRADARADVWALGILLYELASGELPFGGRAPLETVSAILTERAKPLPHQVPIALKLVIARCLEKDPARRYARAADVRDAVKAIRARHAWPVVARLVGTSRVVRRGAAWTAATAVVVAVATVLALKSTEPPIASVAIMPLEHGAAPDDAAHAEAMADAIAAQLGASANVRVLSTASVRRTGRTPLEAGRALGASAIVAGALRRSGDGLSLDLRLVDAGSGATKWSQSFARSQREVLVLQADAVRALADRLHATLTPDARERLTVVPALRPDVYEAYLKGRYEWNQRTAESLRRAVAHFERAIALDPSYAPAYARLADCYNQMGTVLLGSGSPLTYRPLAEAAAIKALQIDPNLADGHAALGYVRHYSWQWADAEQSFQRAIALNPSAPLPRLWYANLLMSKARFDEALQQAHTARDLDPFSLVVHSNIGWILFNAGRPHEAIDVLRKAVALDPSYPQAHWRLADALAEAGFAEEARKEVEEVRRLTNRSPSSLALSAVIAARSGRDADAREALAQLDVIAAREYVTPALRSGAHALLGEVETALDWMERTYADRANAAAYFAVDRDLQPVRNHPRYHALVRRVGLADVRVE